MQDHQPTPDRVLETLRNRSSCREFEPGQIAPEVLEDILFDGIHAPCSSNTQNWHFVVVTDQELKKKLQKCAGGNPHFLTCSALVFLCFQKGWSHDKFAIVQSVAAACYHMIISAHLRGLNTIWNAGIGDTKEVARLLDIPATFEIQGALAIGRAAADAAIFKAPRRPKGDVWSWNRFVRPESSVYPVKPAPDYPFHKISRASNPFAEWRPGIWGWARIADFRSFVIWAKSPTPGIYVSRQQSKLGEMEIGALPALPENAHLVDVMSWGGTNTTALRRQLGADVTVHVAELAETNFKFISERMARERLPAHNVVFGKIENGRLANEDNSVDAVFVGQSLEHMPDPAAMIDEIHRVLRPGGVAVISARNKWSRFGLKYRFSLSRQQVPNQGPFEPISSLALARWLRQRFTVLDSFGVDPGAGADPKRKTGMTRFFSQVVVNVVRKQ